MQKVIKELYTNIKLEGGDGFHVVRIAPCKKIEGYESWKEAKRWCRKNCGYTWGYTSCERYWEDKSKWRIGNEKSVSYFSFADKQDMLLFKLYLNEVDINPTWPSSIRFNIILFKYFDEQQKL